MLKLVPFKPNWITHEKLDMHAIYKRPAWTENEYGERVRAIDKTTGFPAWDITGPLPVRRHNDWTAKGFVYITLADRGSLKQAMRYSALEPHEGEWKDYDQHQTGGPWNYRKYIESQRAIDEQDLAEIADAVEKYGADAVESIRRQQDPNFVLPAKYRKPKAEPKPAEKKAS